MSNFKEIYAQASEKVKEIQTPEKVAQFLRVMWVTHKRLNEDYDIAARDTFQRKMLGSLGALMRKNQNFLTYIAQERISNEEEKYIFTNAYEKLDEAFGLAPSKINWVIIPHKAS